MERIGGRNRLTIRSVLSPPKSQLTFTFQFPSRPHQGDYHEAIRPARITALLLHRRGGAVCLVDETQQHAET